jgi:hypothetical protein
MFGLGGWITCHVVYLFRITLELIHPIENYIRDMWVVIPLPCFVGLSTRTLGGHHCKP